jgi:hypothetical protein
MTEPEGVVTSVQPDLDNVSLRQALIDFEIANARVLDLTRRLMEAQAESAELRAELERLRVEQQDLARVHDAMRSSQAFRWANKIWALRNAVRI